MIKPRAPTSSNRTSCHITLCPLDFFTSFEVKLRTCIKPVVSFERDNREISKDYSSDLSSNKEVCCLKHGARNDTRGNLYSGLKPAKLYHGRIVVR